MASRKKNRKSVNWFIPTVITITVILVVSLIWLLMQSGVKSSRNVLVNPSLIPSAQSIQPEKLKSSAGEMTLVMKKEQPTNQFQKYTFSVVDNTTNVEQIIFTTTASASSTLSIPGNSWSPDNKYIFLQEKIAGNGLTFLVLKTSGEVFSNDQKYLDVGAFFAQKQPKYMMTDVTGWASPTLLIVYTKTDTGEKGPSFWFDITSLSFIQLAR